MAKDRMKGYKNSILMGDFNFCSYRNYPRSEETHYRSRTGASDRPLENDSLTAILPHHRDVWAALHPTEKGYTFDSERNPLIAKYEQMRYDRVLSKCINFAPVAIELIGTETIPSEDMSLRKVHPSDHFGLLTTFDGKNRLLNVHYNSFTCFKT